MSRVPPPPGSHGAPEWALVVLAAAVTGPLAAQTPAPAPFFTSDSVFTFTLTTDFRQLLRDRDPDASEWREATLTYAGPDSALTVPLRVRTRGIFRLQHCGFPPIRLRFRGEEVEGTPFEDLRRPKLVTHCEDSDLYEQYLLQEYAIYRALRLFTPVSFGARLARVTYQDSAGRRDPVTRYAIVTEDPERLAERVGGEVIETKGATIDHLDPAYAALTFVFQYMIGNTDWSVAGLHNIELLQIRGPAYGVPYDWDWSGAISTRYATPAERLGTRTVRQRVYRGYCQPDEVFEPVLARFEALRDSITAVYRAVPDLEPRALERTLEYYDEFYRIIADRGRFLGRVVRETCLR
jgi:hypothetical protein